MEKLPLHNLETPKSRNFVINKKKLMKNLDIRKYVQSLVTEIEAIKLFIKEQLYLPKKFVLEINSNTDTIDSTITESTKLLCKHMNFYHMKTHQKIL